MTRMKGSCARSERAKRGAMEHAIGRENMMIKVHVLMFVSLTRTYSDELNIYIQRIKQRPLEHCQRGCSLVVFIAAEEQKTNINVDR